MAELLFSDIQSMIVNELVDGKYSRMAALSVFAVHKPRIFERGLDAYGSPIGFYVADSVDKRGKNRGGNIVILSFTEAMKRDYQPTREGIVGYGFSSQVEADKSYWNEERYNTDIFALSDEESTMFIDLLGQLMFPE
jgi:hypothetical protein